MSILTIDSYEITGRWFVHILPWWVVVYAHDHDNDCDKHSTGNRENFHDIDVIVLWCVHCDLILGQYEPITKRIDETSHTARSPAYNRNSRCFTNNFDVCGGTGCLVGKFFILCS